MANPVDHSARNVFFSQHIVQVEISIEKWPVVMPVLATPAHLKLKKLPKLDAFGCLTIHFRVKEPEADQSSSKFQVAVPPAT